MKCATFLNVLSGPVLLFAVVQPPLVQADVLSPFRGSSSVRQAVVTGMSGHSTVTDMSGTSSRPVQFHAGISSDDVVSTASGSHVQVLVGNQAVVTVRGDSTIRFLDVRTGHTALHVQEGEIELAVARTGAAVTIHTPSATAVTWGGLIRIAVHPHQDEALRYEAFQVAEGTAQIRGTGSSSRTVALERDHQVIATAGVLGQTMSSPAFTQDARPLPATDGHALTPEIGLRYLKDREKKEAEALLQATLQSMGLSIAASPQAATDVVISTTGTNFGSAPPAAVPVQPVPSQPVTAVSIQPVAAQTFQPAPLPSPAAPPAPIISTTGVAPSQIPQTVPSSLPSIPALLPMIFGDNGPLHGHGNSKR
jgi:hypothetical protein